MQTKDVLDCMNVAIEAAGEAAISSSDIGKLIQVAFGSANKVHRKNVRVQGSRSYMYCGIRNKTDHTAKRPHLSPTTELIADLEYELKHERQIKQDLHLQLQHEKQIRQDLELQLQREKQVKQDLEHQLQHEKQIRQDLELQLQREKQVKQDLEHQLQHEKHEKQIRQDLELQLQREKQVKQDLEHQLQHQMQQIQPIPWDRVRAEIDSELANLQQAGGALTIGPIEESDPSTLSDFTFSQLYDQLLQYAPNTTLLLSTIGGSRDFTRTVSNLKDIHSLTAIAVLAKKNSDHVKGFQLLLSLMLIARATSKSVITTLNHIGICLSYSQTIRYVENAARAIDKRRELQRGHWIVAYDNININKQVRHERFARHAEAWNFTSR